MVNRTKASKPKRLTTSEFFRTAIAYERAQQAAAKANKEKGTAQKALVDDLIRRKVGSLTTPKDFEPFTRVTFVQAEHTEYDADGIWRDLDAKQRRLAFERNVNLNALSPSARKKVLAVLSKEELAEVTTYTLNIDNLSIAVQEDKIPVSVIEPHSTVVKNAPYVSISHAKAK